MRRTLLLATLLLTATALTAAAPTASASLCVSDDPVEEVECNVDRLEKFADCVADRLTTSGCSIPL